ncbi:MAG: HlyD family type I secretion periplasmic adaptor subunit [Alphaproteobacteria bacterium]|nr:MAG: HlyD family type I secretion periplasmic adaptor subunit [Alphaproteobacteria bacterium]
MFGEDAGKDFDEITEKKSANLILYVISAFFVVFLLWASLTEVDRTVRAVGRIVPSSKLQVVSNLEGGVIQEILVKPGQKVEKGQLLIRLNPTLTTAAYGSSVASVEALQAKIARLRAEVTGGTPDYTNLPFEQVEVESSLHSARMAELSSMQSAAAARIQQAERSAIEAESMLAARQSNLAAANRELEMIRPLVPQKIIPGIDLIKAENAAAVAANEVAAAQAALARARSGIAEARASLAQQQSDWKSRAGLELSQAQAEMTVQSQNLPALSDRVDRTAIRAPMTGMVNRVLVTTIGGSVSAGMPIIEIVPSEDVLYVEAMVKPNDIANVGLGQKAQVEITAYNSAVYGRLAGVVTSISPDAIVNEKSGESFYTVEVQATSTLKDKSGKPLKIGPGMLANVSLTGEKRSILAYIFTPITRLSQSAFRD